MSDLPSEPSLRQLRHQARDLQRAVRHGDQDALAEVAQRHPAGRPDHAAAAGFPLSAAQLVVARRYDFPSWARLRRYVEVVERYSRFPARMAAAGPESPAEEFLRLACLRYEDDQPERWAQAHRIHQANPEITQVSVYAAAAVADVSRLAAHLSGDPGAANRQGGPFRWEPLFYLAYARHDPAIGETAVLTAARMLLEAGANPNDGQALYNRMFEPGNDHLELLFEFGLGTGDGGPWQARMGDALDTPEQMVRGELRWALTRGMTERVRLLVERGVDIVSPFGDGITPAERALTTGHPELARYLVAHGAPAPDLRPGSVSSPRPWSRTRPRSPGCGPPIRRRPRGAPVADRLGGGARTARLGRAARRARLRRQRQGPVGRARRGPVADRAARRGDGRPPQPGPEPAPPRRRPRYPRPPLRLHPARLGSLFRPGTARRAARTADRPG